MSNFLKKLPQKFKFDLSNPFGKQAKKKSKKKIWRTILFVGIYAFLACIVFVALAFAWFSKDLPTPNKIANMKPAVSTKIYDRTGQILLYETGNEKRTIVNSDQISPYLKDATVSVEDANFYKHHGVDVKEIFSAVASKLLGRTSRLRGASTITQQYVKNSLLTSDRSLVRKIKEAILAVELEFMFNKDEILTMYLNEIPYGNANAGAEAASRAYYGKPAKDLTLAEAATLAAIPQAPTYYSPYGTHVDKLITRRNYVLDQMVKNGKINAEQASKAKGEDTTTVGTVVKARKDSILAPHFAMYVLEQVANKYGEEKIQKEGLTIITTLDYDKQAIAEKSITDGIAKVEKYGGSNAALVSVDPQTGQILAMVGSKDYFDTSVDGNVNVTDMPRQPGSSFKPFTYVTAFKKPEFSPSRIIYDFQTDFGGGYIPHNYNGQNYGPVTIRTALSNSLNVPAVKTLALAGIDNVIRTAQDMGITGIGSPSQRANYGLSFALGVAEVKPVDMAGAFSVFATEGTKHDVTPILKITDSSNNVLYDWDKEDHTGKQVLDPQAAYEIDSILSDNNARSMVFGTRSALYFPDRTIAAKTGTTSDFKDAWTVGFTPSLATAVWVGNNNNKQMSSGADGSVVAAPIFHSYMVGALGNTPNEDFKRPDGIQDVTVEKYSNKLPDEYSTQTTTDIFASWQVPTDKDTLHKVVQVCKGTDLLAPADAAPALVETKIVTDLHSEMPDNANWEGPVRAWAAANGMAMTAPTGQCDINALTPKVSISEPKNNVEVSGNQKIAVSTTSGNISSVEFFIDDVSIGSVSTLPFEKSFDFSTLMKGEHSIAIVATDSQGVTARDQINIQVSDSNVAPIISNVNVKLSKKNGLQTAAISWITNKPTTSKLTYSLDKQSSSQTLADNNATLPHLIDVDNLLPSQKYNYTITATDTEGKTISKTGTFTTDK